MKRETTTCHTVARPATPSPLAALIGAVYGMGAGLMVALILLSGLPPIEWAESFSAGPIALQGLMTSIGGLLGAAAGYLRTGR